MANGNYAPYPDPIAPSFQSFAERQRMLIDDAIAEQEAQEERKTGVLKAGAKAGFEYDQMLRGYMEAKYANPNLTFWEYSTKPSVGAAFRKQGREQIAEKALVQSYDNYEDYKAVFESRGDKVPITKAQWTEVSGQEIEGLGFRARHKAGLKGIFGRDRPKKVEAPVVGEKVVELTSEQENIGEAGKSLGTIDKLIGGKKPVADTGAQVTIGKIKQAKVLATGTDPATISTEAAAGLEPVAGEVAKAGTGEVAKAGAGEAAKGGLKSALGKGVAGVGYAASIGAGISKLQSKDETARLGGAMQTAGGVAGLVAMTNWWNPVGWAAAIPAVLSVGGGLMGGGGTDPLAGTPLGKYRRRVGIR